MIAGAVELRPQDTNPNLGGRLAGEGAEMATKSGPNATARKTAARKKHVCQLCGAKTMPAKAKSVIVDPPGVGEVKVVKAREGKSYWCSDCAAKKRTSYERAIERKLENGGSSKKSTGRKSPAKSTTRKRGASKKSTPKSATRKRGASTKRSSRKSAKQADPF